MAQYPPAPPGGGYPPAPPGGAYAPAPVAPGAVDPQAAERAVAQWAQARGFELNHAPDVRWYQAWYPCIYAFPVQRITRELRATSGDDQLWMAEGAEDDPIKRATGEDRHLYLFITSPRFSARSAVRSKAGSGGVIDELGQGFGSLFATKPAGVLGDSAFEAKFDVTVPSRQEGDLALPPGLRALLMQSNWRGILEVRPGGMLLIPFGPTLFEPQALDQLVVFANGLLHAR